MRRGSAGHHRRPRERTSRSECRLCSRLKLALRDSRNSLVATEALTSKRCPGVRPLSVENVVRKFFVDVVILLYLTQFLMCYGVRNRVAWQLEGQTRADGQRSQGSRPWCEPNYDIAALRRSAYLTVANRNTHTYQATCVKSKKGISGCRMSVPYEHGIPETRVVELDPMMLEVE